MKEYNYTFDKGLQIGLRTTPQNMRNQQALVSCSGAFPHQGAFGTLTGTPSTISLTGIDPPPLWPWPQLFVLKQVTIILTETQLYEVIAGVNVLKLTGLTAGLRWTIADFHRFIIGTNGKQLIYRDGDTLTWTSGSYNGLENCTSVLNYKGQLLMTAYGVTIPDDLDGLIAPNLDFSSEVNSQYVL